MKERAERARAALERMRAEKAKREKTHAKDEAKKSEPKVSLSDPQSRSMRFPDGPFVRPIMHRSRWRPGQASLLQ